MKNGTMLILLRLAVRQALARRRWIFILLIAALPVLVSLLTRIYGSTDKTPIEMVSQGLSTLVLTAVVPIIALILASSVLGAEVDDGTVTYLLTKPLPRWKIAFSKVVVISIVGGVVSALATLAAGWLILKGLDPTRVVIGYSVATLLGSLLYSALFLALCLITRRGMLVGLVYLIVWEGALAGFFAGTKPLSVRQYMLSIAYHINTLFKDPLQPATVLPFSTTYMMATIVLVGAMALCIQRLKNFEIGKVG